MAPSPADRARRRPGREALINLALVAGSLLFVLALCEFVVFRLLTPGSDVPRNAFVNGVVRYAPGQSGVWRVRDDIAAPYAINAQGWNAPQADYPAARRPGVARVAVVGDSFVEAMQVPVGESFVEQAALALGGPDRIEAFRFAIAGAPLSQYVHMVEREVLRFRPDRIVVLLVHNDFDESFLLRPGRYTSSFLKFEVRPGQRPDEPVGETAPAPWTPGALEWLRHTGTARFFLYRWQVRPQLLLDAVLGPARADGAPRFGANIDLGAVLAEEPRIRIATAHGLKRLKALADSIGARLDILMDGDRGAIQAGAPTSQALRLNAIAAEAAAAAGVPFHNLQPLFAADFAASRQRFDFPSDGHWNAHAHRLVGRELARILAAP
jgi:hypothetical protein